MEDIALIEDLQRLVAFLEDEARIARNQRRYEAATTYFRGAQTVAGALRKLRLAGAR